MAEQRRRWGLRPMISFPLEASETTRLVVPMMFAWSLASHIVCEQPPATVVGDGGVPSRRLSPGELEEFLPLEPLSDLLLPVVGASVSALGLQLTLGLSMAQPLLLLAVPHIDEKLLRFHERLLGWHLGGLFGQPMLIAQIAVLRAECSLVRSPRQAAGTGAAVLGALVGAYSAGALAGSALRRVLDLRLLGVEPLLGVATHMQLRIAIVLMLVALNFLAILCNGTLLSEEVGHGAGHNEEEHIFLLNGAEGQSEDSRESLSLWQKALAGAQHGMRHVMMAFMRASDLLAARAFLMLGTGIVIGTAPLDPVDLFENTPLHRGFEVLWFDFVGALASGLAMPLMLGSPLKLTLNHCIDVCYGASLAMCVASFLSLQRIVVIACGLVLSVAAAFVGPVLTALLTARLSAHNAPVALGWSLLVGGVAQLMGLQLGSGLLFPHYSQRGISATAGVACASSWCFARLFPSRKKRSLPAERPNPGGTMKYWCIID
eukprot:gnl/TRDRNA2_/TRDRNA2_200083_c0_seq1.p1 gnl/TRDRNA2_/TRDRNA2_200083_c0~~gnl/TRDRNA2_/TRDRNA2_200083_c0_seq1.p1  ORF type:complete len:489 (+),score=77.96 gnl/TRDRNA2_/TRDRNA2_200083_c0_seq1:107-1573(+)